MISISRSKRFETEYKKFVKHNPKRANSIIKALGIFVNNPIHPSLNLEKLKGSNIWTMRISSGDRIFFLWINKATALLLDIGPHDKYRNY